MSTELFFSSVSVGKCKFVLRSESDTGLYSGGFSG